MKVSAEAEGWTPARTREASAYRDSLIRCVNEGNEEEIRRLFDEIHEDDEFSAAVWSLLPTPIRNYMHDIMREHHGTNAYIGRWKNDHTD